MGDHQVGKSALRYYFVKGATCEEDILQDRSKAFLTKAVTLRGQLCQVLLFYLPAELNVG